MDIRVSQGAARIDYANNTRGKVKVRRGKWRVPSQEVTRGLNKLLGRKKDGRIGEYTEQKVSFEGHSKQQQQKGEIRFVRALGTTPAVLLHSHKRSPTVIL